MNDKKLSIAIGACVASSLFSGSASAQGTDQKTAIQDSLTISRVIPESGAALNRDTAGYFRLTLSPERFVRENVCPRSKAERNKLKNASASIWQWILKKKKDWGAGVEIVYGGRSPTFEADGFKPDMEAKFFTVVDGANHKKCEIANFDYTKIKSPLIPMRLAGADQDVHLKFTSWYSEASDREGILNLVTGVAGLAGLVGVPVGLLDKIKPVATDKIKTEIDNEKKATHKLRLNPHESDTTKYIAYLGLREPTSATQGTDLKVKLELESISSLFSIGSSEYTDLSGLQPYQVLSYGIPSVDPETGSTTTTPLRNFLSTQPSYISLNQAGTFDAISGSCSVLHGYLRDDLKFSAVDAAVIILNVIKEKVAVNPQLEGLYNFDCLVEPAINDSLKLVSISVAKSAPNIVAVTQDQMKSLMNKVVSYSYTPAENLDASFNSIFGFPFIVSDPENHFGWPEKYKIFEQEDMPALKNLFDDSSLRFGCYTYFENAPYNFAPFLGNPVADTSLKDLRKSAALVRMKDGTVRHIQFRYSGVTEEPFVSGFGFVARDQRAEASMKLRNDCKNGTGDREWMAAFLRDK